MSFRFPLKGCQFGSDDHVRLGRLHIACGKSVKVRIRRSALPPRLRTAETEPHNAIWKKTVRPAGAAQSVRHPGRQSESTAHMDGAWSFSEMRFHTCLNRVILPVLFFTALSVLPGKPIYHKLLHVFYLVPFLKYGPSFEHAPSDWKYLT